MTIDPARPAALVRRGGEVCLPGDSLTDLLRAILDKGRPCRFRAKGASMSPFVKDGDIVTVSPIAARRLGAGAVVAFLHPGTGRVAVHRIIGERGGRFLLRGDNAYAADGALPKDRILGVVTEVVRHGRRRKGITDGWAPVIARLSRTGGLVRGLVLARRISGRADRRSP
jgi:hypothetical protein